MSDLVDAESLEAVLAARWPDATGANRASTDETHRLALLHPLYDGFLSIEVTARCDLDGVFVIPDEPLVDVVTSHHRTGPLERGQVLPIDLELHPGKVREPASTGLLEFVDAEGEPVAPAVRLTIATDFKLGCELAGLTDGPLPPAEFEQHAAALASGSTSAKRVARAIQRANGERVRWWRR